VIETTATNASNNLEIRIKLPIELT
jgi:hypothetical protein